MVSSRMGAPQSGQWSDGVAKNACVFRLAAMDGLPLCYGIGEMLESAKVLTNR
jgi:hypothetical protein